MRFLSIVALLFVMVLPSVGQNVGHGDAVEIVRAEYGATSGWIDVTHRVLSLVRGDTLMFRVNPGALRIDSRSGNGSGVLQLTVRRRNGRERRLTYRSGDLVNLRVIRGNDRDDDHWSRDRDDRDRHGRRAGACFYRDGFDSAEFCLDAGQSAASLPGGFNDSVTSMRVFGGARVTAFDSTNFSGTSQTFTEDVRDLRFVLAGRWNDRISSVRVDGGDYGRDDRWPDHRDRDRGRDGACFYADGFGSNRFCVNAGETMASLPAGFNDQITSIEIFGRAQVVAFRESGFRGEQQVFNDSVRDLRYVLGGRWSDQISSLRVEAGSGRNWGRNVPRYGACFYLDGFNSQSFCLEAGRDAASLPPGFQRQITAIEVFGGAEVSVYSDTNFRGDRQMIAQDVPDLRYVLGGRWNDRIESVRVDMRR